MKGKKKEIRKDRNRKETRMCVFPAPLSSPVSLDIHPSTLVENIKEIHLQDDVPAASQERAKDGTHGYRIPGNQTAVGWTCGDKVDEGIGGGAVHAQASTVRPGRRRRESASYFDSKCSQI
jgi:hypothetical protein